MFLTSRATARCLRTRPTRAFVGAHQLLGGDDIFWGESANGTLSGNIIPGRYDVICEQDTGTTIPQNNHQRIACRNILPPVL